MSVITNQENRNETKPSQKQLPDPADYCLILSQLDAVTENENNVIANLANASSVLNMNLEQINWVGFYLAQKDRLILGPFQGKPACVRIAFGKGVCGTAAALAATQLVANVHAFPGHIACDGASNAEIVVPLMHDGKVVAVLDIDSPLHGRFTEADQKGLEACAALLAERCQWNTLS